MATLRSADDLREVYVNAVKAADAESAKLTDFTDGSINDLMASAAGLIGSEVISVIVEQFNRTFIANTVGAAMDELVTDHFGDEFARLGAQKALAVVVLERPTTAEGNISIPIGTRFSTDPDENNESQIFESVIPEIMTGTELYLTVRAVEAGTAGNVEALTIVNIDDDLGDESLTVENPEAADGGAAAQTDAEYLEYLGKKINSLRGGTKASIRASLLAIPGIEKANPVTRFQKVINYNPVSETTEGEPYTIVNTIVYVAGASGNANAALLALAEDALDEEQAFGVNITVESATAQTINWKAQITLDYDGPNYAEFESNVDRIEETMREYIEGLQVGESFDRDAAKAYVLDRWGQDGTGDLAENGFSTISPTGNVQVTESVILIAGTIEIE